MTVDYIANLKTNVEDITDEIWNSWRKIHPNPDVSNFNQPDDVIRFGELAIDAVDFYYNIIAHETDLEFNDQYVDDILNDEEVHVYRVKNEHLQFIKDYFAWLHLSWVKLNQNVMPRMHDNGYTYFVSNYEQPIDTYAKFIGLENDDDEVIFQIANMKAQERDAQNG